MQADTLARLNNQPSAWPLGAPKTYAIPNIERIGTTPSFLRFIADLISRAADFCPVRAIASDLRIAAAIVYDAASKLGGRADA